MMKKLLLLLALGAAIFGQVNPSLSATSLRPGQTTTLSVTLVGPATLAAFQWSYLLGGLTPSTPVIGPVASAAGKSIFSSPAIDKTLIVGTTGAAQGSIAAGVLATVVLTVPAGMAPGTIQVGVAAVRDSDATGTGGVESNGPTIAVTILPVLLTGDLNGDGVVNATDFGLELNQILGITPCTNGDLDGNGVCDVRDLVLIAKQI